MVNDDNDSEIVAYMLYIADNQFMANFLSKNINSLTTNSLWNAIYNNAFAVYVNKSEIFDKTVFKAIGLDSKFDARNLKDKDIFEKTKKYAPTQEIKENIVI